MFTLGLAFGIYAYSIFFFGLIGLLYRPLVIIFTLCFLAAYGYYNRKKLLAYSFSFSGTVQKTRQYIFQRKIVEDKLFLLILGIIVLQAVINVIGALGPELSFDALWYHLTIPKTYLTIHSLWIPKSGILYYAYMPKIVEMLYTGALSFGTEVFAKLLHFGFGILSLFVLYTIGKKFFNPLLSLVAVAIFYSNPVVGWESISAYIDLGRTFFELLAFLALLNWSQSRLVKWFSLSAIFAGLAIATKLLALGSLVIFLVLTIYFLRQREASLKKIIQFFSYYLCIALFIPVPWIIFSFANTGNPVYPFFSHVYPVAIPFHLLNPVFLVGSFWKLFTHADDPISPMYLALLPVIILFFRKLDKKLHVIFLYGFAALLVWYVTPQTGGGRFIVPYLPIFSLCVVSIFAIKLPTKFVLFLSGCLFITFVISLGYRLEANIKFVPVIVHKETKQAFLTKHLNFSFGDFIDSDGYFAKHIKPTDRVLLYGFHNLYYVDFPYIEVSSVKTGDTFTYIATQNTSLPPRFRYWKLVYINPITKVQLYSAGAVVWVY